MGTTTCIGELRRKMACEKHNGRILFLQGANPTHPSVANPSPTQPAPPPPIKRRHSEGDVDQLCRRRCRGVLRRGAGLVEDLEDLVLAGVDPRPSSPLGFTLVAPGESVGYVVSRRHPFEVRSGAPTPVRPPAPTWLPPCR